MGYLSTRLSRLERAAGIRRDEIDDGRRRAQDAAWAAVVGGDPDASDLSRALARRLLGRPNKMFAPPGTSDLSTDEIRQRLDERVEALRQAAL